MQDSNETNPGELSLGLLCTPVRRVNIGSLCGIRAWNLSLSAMPLSAGELDEAETFRHPKDKWVVLLGMT